MQVDTTPPKKNIIKALLAVQKELKNAPKTGKSHHGPYATLEDLLGTIKEPCLKAGLVVIQGFEVINQGSDESPILTTCLTTTLMHESGEELSSQVIIPENKNVQQWGSTVTYMKRYSLSAFFFIGGDIDEDGAQTVPAGDIKPRAVSGGKTSYRKPAGKR
jgi:hypothetical protein